MSKNLLTRSTENLLAPSPAFRMEALKSVSAIALFILVYFSLFILATSMAALCVYGGIQIFLMKPGTWTFLLGVGIAACGVMVFVFLVKFLFSSTKSDDSDSILITEKDHPKLFQSIRSLAERIGTQMPKKVFISTDVDACVFYNSSFWSMFLPVRKNLKIGLGLVNSVNVSELEAVIAHEFGHFSQRSMKVGSWAYQVNRIIYDMLYNNDRFGQTLNHIASSHFLLNIFVGISIKIIQGIQWILQQMYKVVNKSYLALSRQMEFHADLVASSVSGSNNLIHSLRRIELADPCFQATLDSCNTALIEKKVVADFYSGHRLLLQHAGKMHKLPFEGNLPVVENDSHNKFNRVNYKDQWSSHPTTNERTQYLAPFGLVTETDCREAWTLLDNTGALREHMTRKIYRNVEVEQMQQSLDGKAFESLINKEIEKGSYPSLFKGYYDRRQVELFDVETVRTQVSVFKTFDEVFNEDAAALPTQLETLQQDMGILASIENGSIQTRSFDFDGQKYESKEAAGIVAQLKEEEKLLAEKLKSSDRSIFRFFCSVASPAEADILSAEYKLHFEHRANADRFFESGNRMMDHLAPVFRGDTITMEEIQKMIAELQESHEPEFKAQLREWMNAGAFDNELRESSEKFRNSNYQYFHEKGFFENELNELNTILQQSWSAINNFLFDQFKAITERQARIFNETSEKVLMNVN